MTLPHGWAEATLGDVADFIMGQAPPGADCNTDGNGIPFVKAGEFGTTRPVIREWTTKPLKMASADDVFICVVGATAGKLNLGADCAIGRSVAAIRPSAATSADFIYPRLKSEVARLRAGSTGTAQGVISREMLAEIALGLPPLAEQRRIVAKLDALTARLARARAELDRVPVLAARQRAATLHRVFSRTNGELANLGALTLPSAPIRYGVLQPGEEKGIGVRMIRVCDLQAMRVAWSELRRIAPEIDTQFASARVQDGDILLSVVGTIGRIAVVQGMTEPTNIARAVARIRPDPSKVLPKWLALRMAAPDCQRTFEGDAREVARKTLNVSLIKAVRVQVPSLEEQARAVQAIESAIARADRLEAEATRARALLDRLESAILAKAFRGELVPQDPNDEPAQALLDRIRTQRAAAPKARRGRKARGEGVAA